MSKNHRGASNWPKHVLQLGTLAGIIFFVSGLAAKVFPKMQPVNPEAYCPFGGLEAFATYLQRGSLPCSMTSMQIIMGLVLAVAVILFSKLFCAFLCPVGTVEDWLAKLRGKLRLPALEIPQGSIADGALRFIKYGLLFWIVYMTVSASELFCKNLDPYYAVATGFKGEINLVWSIIALCIVFLCGLFTKRFWCKYICPLGAAFNTLKFWIWVALAVGIWWALNALGITVGWGWLLGAFCLLGWALEVFVRKPKAQLLHVCVDESRCGKICHNCQKACPYNIDVPVNGGIVRNVDCTLCGECVAACPSKALSVSVCKPTRCRSARFLPAILAVVLVALAYIIGGKLELPTINESWGIEDGMKLENLKVDGLKSVKCFGSSMAFKAKMEKVAGVHGVKTYVGTHTVVIKYDPSVTNEDAIRKQLFVPSHFRVWSPDPKKIQELKIVTIRTERMYDKLDLNYLGLQFRTTGKSIFGVASEYDCPLVVRVYMSPEENLDEKWFEEVVSRKVLAMPVHGGGVKETPVDFKFVRMEEGEGRIGIDEYLHMMFDPFKAEYKGKYPQGDTTIVKKRTEVYKDKPQFVYEIVDQNYEKPIIKRSLPFLSNHISKEEGIIGTYLCLNEDLTPCIQIRFAAPMTAKRIWELINQETWTITYKEGEVKEMPAKMTFKEEGTVKKYEKK